MGDVKEISPYGRKRYYLRMPGDVAVRALEEWIYRGYPCDIRYSRALKTPRYCVMTVEGDVTDPKTREGIPFIHWVKNHYPLETLLEVRDVAAVPPRTGQDHEQKITTNKT